MKKIDWDSMYTDPIRRNLSGSANRNPKYSSGKDLLQKAMANELVREEAEKNMAQTLPAMQALLKCRLANKTPLTIMRPLAYISSELQKSTNGMGDVTGAKFVDVQKVLYPGTQLVLNGVDHNLQEFLFRDENGAEVVLPYSAQKELMISTDIYESVVEFINNKGE